MGWKPKKKPKKLSYDEQKFVQKLIDDAKAKRKTWRGYAVLKRNGTSTELKLSGLWQDIDELKKCADEFAESLRKASGKKWDVLEVVDVNAAVEVDNDTKLAPKNSTTGVHVYDGRSFRSYSW